MALLGAESSLTENVLPPFQAEPTQEIRAEPADLHRRPLDLVIGRQDKIIQSGVRSRVKRKEGAEMNIAFLIGRIIIAAFWLLPAQLFPVPVLVEPEVGT
jgi:hypothetical protein